MSAFWEFLKALFGGGVRAAELLDLDTTESEKTEAKGGRTMLDLSMFSPEVAEATRAAIEANVRWRTELENANRIAAYRLGVENYNLMVQHYRGNAEVLDTLVAPEVPTAAEWVWGHAGRIEMAELGTPLVSPPLPLLPKVTVAPQPEGQVVFGRSMADDGYPGWYAASMQHADGTTSSTTVAPGTEAEGPDERTYILTKMGLSGMARYWVLKQ